MARQSIDELCAFYDNENAHTEHVTKLALHLFDQTRARLGLPENSRRLLEAAGRLHDVGYSIDPVHHPQRSAVIVLEEGVKGFRQSELDQIVQIMIRHSGKMTANNAPKRLLQLAACLRIGDGLEYSHAQTSRIVSVRRVDSTIHVAVECGQFPSSIARADRKADLWRAVFPYDIRFSEANVPKKPRRPLLQPDTPILEAARRLLWIQFKTILANLDDALAGKSSEPVHRIRVALRRLRSLLHVFRKHLPKQSQQTVEKILDNIGEELGPVRDLDVWLDWLQSSEVRAAAGRGRLWPAFLRHHLQRRVLVQATVHRALQGPHFAAQRLKINRLLRVELPRLIRAQPDGSLPKLAATQLRKALRRGLRKGHLRHSTSPRKLHRLRIELRKARYLAEFFNPVLGRNTAKLCKRLRQVEQVLGRVHDADMAAMHLVHEGPTPPRALAKYLKEQRAGNLNKLDRAWQRMDNPVLQKQVQQELKAARA